MKIDGIGELKSYLVEHRSRDFAQGLVDSGQHVSGQTVSMGDASASISTTALPDGGLRADLEGRLKVDIVSAYELSEGQAKSLSEAVARRLGRQVDVSVTVDSALIGGVVIRAGDLVIDASMRGRLAQMSASLGVAA